MVAWAVVLIAFSGCATVERPDPTAAAASVNARSAADIARFQAMGTVTDPTAQAGMWTAYILTGDTEILSDYAAYAAAISAQNKAQGAVAVVGVGALGDLGLLWQVGKIAESAGGTEVNNTTTGDGNTSAGRNIADDHSSPVDVTAATIGGGGDGDGAQGPVTLPQ